MATPSVTIVVVPREQFSKAEASLESIYATTPPPFDLVYVDGNSPPRSASSSPRKPRPAGSRSCAPSAT